jgi:Zn-dependent M32 family carboxypeptidase
MTNTFSSLREERFRRGLILANPIEPKPTLSGLGLDSSNPDELFEKIINQSKQQRIDTLKFIKSKMTVAEAVKTIVSTIQGIKSIGAGLVETPTVTAATSDSGWQENRPKKNFEGVAKSYDWESIITFILVAAIAFGLVWFAETHYPVLKEDKNQGSPMDLIRNIKDFITINGDRLLEYGKKFIDAIRNLKI